MHSRQARPSSWCLRPALAGLGLLWMACNQAPRPAAAPAEPAHPTFDPTATIQDIMLSMVDPQADAIWEAVATVVTVDGIEERRPSTDEEWDGLYHRAITLVEATNLLRIGGRQVARPGFRSENPGIELEPEQIQELIDQDPDTWNQLAGGLHDAAKVMLDAIVAKDAQMLFDHGGDLDAACESCHRHYWYPEAQGPPPSGSTVGANASAPAPEQVADSGTIAGRIRLEGKPPGNVVIRMGLDPKCKEIQGDAMVVQEEVAATADGSLANVFVRLAGSLPSTPVPTEPVVVDQSGCLFAPRVVGARVGQIVRFQNSDPLFHNVHSLSAADNSFNISQPIQGVTSDVEIGPEPGMLRIKCDVHRWMTEYIGVVDHPWFAVSDREGRFTLHGVPPGEHTLVAWHERFGTLEQTVGVTSGGTATVELSYSGDKKL